MKFRATEEATQGKTAPLANKSSRAVSISPPKQRTRIKPKADPLMVSRGIKVVSPRSGSKTAKVLALLKRPQGAALKELIKATGWQPHSIRGFLSGKVVKKMGLKISSIKTESGERRYGVKA